MKPVVRLMRTDRPPTRRSIEFDTAFAPGQTTRPFPQREDHGQGWNVAHPREEHLPSASFEEIMEDGGFNIGHNTSAHGMRATMEPVMYGPSDRPATDFLAAHGFNPNGEPFKGDR